MKSIICVCFISLISITVSAQESIREEFEQDTTRVENQFRKQMDTDYSTVGMGNAYREREKEYDKLLNKYYQRLLSSGDAEEKEAIRKSQRDWIKLRDSEIALIWVLKGKAYKDMGGGTMWSTVAAERQSELTAKRVYEIYEYLTFSDAK